MRLSFWKERWIEGRTPFHLPGTNPALTEYWPRVAGDPPACDRESMPAAPNSSVDLPQGRVLVPLCGKSHDMLWLCRRGFDVVGVEFVREAVEAFDREHSLGLSATREAGLTAFRGAHAGRTLEVWVGDFFALSREQVGPLSYWYDRAALVAVEPQIRRRYCGQIRRLIPPHGRGLIVTYDHDAGSGPPFSIPETELHGLLDGRFHLTRLDEQEALEPRFRQRGATRMVEQVWSAGPAAAPGRRV